MKKSEKWKRGLPYVGNKGQLASDIIDILPTGSRLVDVFGGGGSISLHAYDSRKWDEIVYNELNKSVFALFKELTSGNSGIDFFDFIIPKREELKKLVERYKHDTVSVEDTVRLITWSFSNNMKDFLWSGKCEGGQASTEQLKIEFTKECFESYGKRDSIENFHDYCRKMRKEQLQRSEQLEQLQQLQQLQRLQRSQQLEQSNPLIIYSSLDYKQVQLSEDDVVYLDPPYAHSRSSLSKYKEVFNNDEFIEWYQSLPNEHIYISGYEQLPNTEIVYRKVKHSMTAKGTRRQELLMKRK